MAGDGTYSLIVLMVGGLVVAATLLKAITRKLRLPSLVVFVAIGLGLRIVASRWSVLSAEGSGVLEFLADVGIICLLFRVGLESDLPGLLRQLRRASVVWVGDVTVSGALGFVTARYLLGLGLIPSLFVGIALTATSVGIPMQVWQRTGKLRTPTGELLLDVAELDDISGIVLMAGLFAVVPVLRGGSGGALAGPLLWAIGSVVLRLAVFGAVCLLFSRFVEGRMTRFFEKIEPTPAPMITVVGVGFVMAALAGLLGFSVAIGAFFAGLVFSRDPDAVKMDASFEALYELFVPFFFIGIGLKMDPSSMTAAVGLGMVILAAGVTGKAVGAGGPVLATMGVGSGLLVAVSMAPRAEIAMIVMQRGRSMGDWAVPAEVYSAMVLVSAVTCVASPLLLSWLLRRHPPEQAQADGASSLAGGPQGP